MGSLFPGDLVRLKPNDSNKVNMVQIYQVKDLEHLCRVLNNPEKIISVSTKPFSGYMIPNIDAVFGHVHSNIIGLYLGFVNVEDYGRIYLYHAILLEQKICIIKDDGLELEFGKREAKVVK